MGFLKDLVHKASNDTVTKAVVKVDPLASGVNKTVVSAVDTGYGKPLGKDKSGLDVLGAGPIYQEFHIGGNPDKPQDRAVGRGVGSIFAGYGIGAAASSAGVSSSTVSTVKTAAQLGAAYESAEGAQKSASIARSAANGGGIGELPVPLEFDFSVPADQAAAAAPQASGLSSALSPASSSSGSSTLSLVVAALTLALSLNPAHG